MTRSRNMWKVLEPIRNLIELRICLYKLKYNNKKSRMMWNQRTRNNREKFL